MDSPLRDDIDNYQLAREKIMLEEASWSEGEESLSGLSEEEVLPLDTDQFYASEAESEGSEVSELGTRAWGTSKKAFYSRQEVGVVSSDDGDEYEEREAVELQDKMAATLSESDFLSLHSLGPVDTSVEVEAVKRDLSQLTDEDKLSLLERCHPELEPLLQSVRVSVATVTRLLALVDDHFTRELTELRLHVNLCYCINAMFYVLMKGSQESTHSHPVFSRLLALKQLLGQLDILHPSPSPSNTVTQTARKDDTKSAVAAVAMTTESSEDPLAYYERVKSAKQRPKHSVKLITPTDQEDEFIENGEKRPITYQISRNKGLTPRRSKEQRNPRVKHRKKFKKAVQKRKGQVLPVQNELSRYAGETTGIRSHLARSVKIK